MRFTQRNPRGFHRGSEFMRPCLLSYRLCIGPGRALSTRIPSGCNEGFKIRLGFGLGACYSFWGEKRLGLGVRGCKVERSKGLGLGVEAMRFEARNLKL